MPPHLVKQSVKGVLNPDYNAATFETDNGTVIAAYGYKFSCGKDYCHFDSNKNIIVAFLR